MTEILKEKVKKIILAKDEFTEEEMKLILWYIKSEKPSIIDVILNSTKKIVKFINSNLKEDKQ